MTIATQNIGRAVTIFLVISLGSASASEDPPAPEQARAVVERLNTDIGKQVEALGDWEHEAAIINSSMDRLWERNGWTSEPDLFAHRLTKEITSIPPSRFAERMEKLTDLCADRYRMAPAQRSRFQAGLYRETFGFFASNAGVIAKHAGEYVTSRVQGVPITSEQAARWTRESDDAMSDAMSRCARMVEQMLADATDDQREIIEEDFRSFNGRMNKILEQRKAWARGEWSPEEWGIEPSESAGDEGDRSKAVPSTDGRDAPSDLEKPTAERESTWRRYVRVFIAEHELDAGQREAAYSILLELEDRAAQYRRSHADELTTVSVRERATSETYKPLRAMFEELKVRLAALLTETQRAAGD